jgi:ferritin-like metal-binding protein YciE
MAAQKVKHYEIATYGSLAQFVKTLGKTDLLILWYRLWKKKRKLLNY